MKKSLLSLIVIHFFNSSSVLAQYEIKPEQGYTPQIGIMVDMLEDLKNRIVREVQDLSQEQTDYLFDEQANSIGAIVMHLAATEVYYQVETLEGRSMTKEERELWGVASNLGAASREELQGKPVAYYLNLWDQVREKTLEGLKTKDDDWFAANIDEGINNHWAWFHVMEHQAHHRGQIALIKKRLPE
ncbi:MAG: DinB family protein [Fulvivirga sp.]|nr:DinB family protein [Fulvivirga sp.]